MGTTNILDLNNRLTKVEKENVAQNSYTSLKNKPKINSVILTGNKTLADIGAAAAADVGNLNALTTVDKSSCVAAINELNSGLIVYFDSDKLTFTDIASDATQNQIVSNYNVPNGYTVISRVILTYNITGSWNIAVTYLDRQNSVTVHNYGTSANTVEVVVRSLCVKSGS